MHLHGKKGAKTTPKKKPKPTKTQNERLWDKLHKPKVIQLLTESRSGLSGASFLASTMGQPVERIETSIEKQVKDYFLGRVGPRGLAKRIDQNILQDATELVLRGMGTAIRDPRFRIRRSLNIVKEAHIEAVPLYRQSYLIDGPEKIEQIRFEIGRLEEFARHCANTPLFRELGSQTVRLLELGSSIGQSIPILKKLGFGKIVGLENCKQMQNAAPMDVRRNISIQCVTEPDLPVRHFHAGVWTYTISYVPMAISVQTIIRLNKSMMFGASVMLTANIGTGGYSTLGEEIEADNISETEKAISVPGMGTRDMPECTLVLFTPKILVRLAQITGFEVSSIEKLGKLTDPDRQMILYLKKIAEVKEINALAEWYKICPQLDNCM